MYSRRPQKHEKAAPKVTEIALSPIIQTGSNEAIALIREMCHENNAAFLTVSHDAEVLGQFEEATDFAQVNRT